MGQRQMCVHVAKNCKKLAVYVLMVDQLEFGDSCTVSGFFFGAQGVDLKTAGTVAASKYLDQVDLQVYT